MYIVDYEKMKGCESTILLIELLLSGAIVFAFLFLQPVVRDNIWGLCLLMITTCIFGYARVVFQQQCKFGIYTLLEIIRVLLFLMMIGGCFLNKNVKLTASLVIGFQCLSLASAMPSLIKKISGIKWFEPIRVRNFYTSEGSSSSICICSSISDITANRCTCLENTLDGLLCFCLFFCFKVLQYDANAADYCEQCFAAQNLNDRRLPRNQKNISPARYSCCGFASWNYICSYNRTLHSSDFRRWKVSGINWCVSNIMLFGVGLILGSAL